MKILVTYNQNHKSVVEATSKEEAKSKVRRESCNPVRVWNDFKVITSKEAYEFERVEAAELENMFRELADLFNSIH